MGEAIVGTTSGRHVASAASIGPTELTERRTIGGYAGSIRSNIPSVATATFLRYAGLACLGGGLSWLVSGLAESAGCWALGTSSASYLWFALFALSPLGGPLGLHAQRATGHGRLGQAGWVGLLAAQVGLLSYSVGALVGVLQPEREVVLVSRALGALLVGLGMVTAGTSVIVARRLTGWRAAAPILVGLYYVVMIPVQVMVFIIPTGRPSVFLLAGWGLPWMLLGAALLASAPQAQSSASVAVITEAA